MEQKKKKKKKFFPLTWLSLVLYMVLGAYIGYNFEFMMEEYNFAIMLCAIFITVYVVLFLSIIFHEMGHLVFGLLSGYKFSCFRFLSFAWVKDEQGIKLKRYSLAGTGGQCLMVPPEMVNGEFPVALYNLGGPLMDLILGLVFFVISLFIDNELACTLLRVGSLYGLISAITNGVPMRNAMINNDGYNALMLSKDKKAMRALWLQLKISDMVIKGRSLKEMPDDWFVVPTDEEMQNSLIAATGVFCCNRMMEQHKFKEADELMKHFMEIDVLIGIYKGLAVCDCIYCEMVGENRSDVIDAYFTKEQENFMKAMKNNITVTRTMYLYTLLHEKNYEKAEKLMEQFNKIAKKHPYPNDVIVEKELIQLAINNVNMQV